MRSLAFVLLIAVSTTALAQAKEKKRPASVLKGDDDDEPQKQATPKVDPGPALCGDADRALGLGLSYAFEQAPEEIRVLAIEDLGLLGDPRALDAIASLVVDSNPNVQSAAVRAAASFTTLRAAQILENVVRHPRLPVELKEQALRSMPFQRKTRVRDFLVAVTRSGAYPPPIRRVAQESLAAFDEAMPKSSPTGASK